MVWLKHCQLSITCCTTVTQHSPGGSQGYPGHQDYQSLGLDTEKLLLIPICILCRLQCSVENNLNIPIVSQRWSGFEEGICRGVSSGTVCGLQENGTGLMTSPTRRSRPGCLSGSHNYSLDSRLSPCYPNPDSYVGEVLIVSPRCGFGINCLVLGSLVHCQ